MAAADCEMCGLLGYRSCDECGSPVFPDNVARSPLGRELCAYCLYALAR